jgi:hypothetical protein
MVSEGIMTVIQRSIQGVSRGVFTSTPKAQSSQLKYAIKKLKCIVYNKTLILFYLT